MVIGIGVTSPLAAYDPCEANTFLFITLALLATLERIPGETVSLLPLKISDLLLLMRVGLDGGSILGVISIS